MFNNFDSTQDRTWDLSHPKRALYHCTTLTYIIIDFFANMLKNQPFPLVKLNCNSHFWNRRKILYKKQSCFK